MDLPVPELLDGPGFVPDPLDSPNGAHAPPRSFEVVLW